MKKYRIPISAVSQIINTPLIITLITLVFYSIFLFLYLQKHSFNASYTVTAGDFYVDRQEMPQDFVVQRQSQGYDGLFYYRLALDPFTNNKTANGISLDLPAFRQQRILYPLLAWILSLGHHNLIPQILLLINLICIALISYFGAKISQSNKMPAIFGLAFVFYAGFLFTISRDLTEILEMALLMGGVLALSYKKFLLAAIFFSLAILTKESALIAPAGYLIYYFYSSKLKTAKSLHREIFILPFLTFFIFHIWIFFQWHTLDIDKTLINFDIPLAGFIYFLNSLLQVNSHFFQVYILELIYIVVFCSIMLYIIYKAKRITPSLFIWVLYFICTLLFSKAIWIEDWAFMRVFSGFFVFGIIYLLEIRRIILYPLTLVNFILWIYVAQNIINVR